MEFNIARSLPTKKNNQEDTLSARLIFDKIILSYVKKEEERKFASYRREIFGYLRNVIKELTRDFDEIRFSYSNDWVNFHCLLGIANSCCHRLLDQGLKESEEFKFCNEARELLEDICDLKEVYRNY